MCINDLHDFRRVFSSGAMDYKNLQFGSFSGLSHGSDHFTDQQKVQTLLKTSEQSVKKKQYALITSIDKCNNKVTNKVRFKSSIQVEKSNNQTVNNTAYSL